MQSEKKKKEFEPQSVAVANLYVENQRLQRKCYAYKRQIRGMQKAIQLYRAMEIAVEFQKTAKEYSETVDQLLTTRASHALTTTAEETTDATRN